MSLDATATEIPGPLPAEAEDAGTPRDAQAPQDAGAPQLDTGLAAVLDAGTGASDACSLQLAPTPSNLATNVRLVSDDLLGAFLATASGEPLYMYASDVARSGKTTCLGECAQTWQPFDVAAVSPDCALSAREFGRFHRDDGAWQTTYKGHPLYRRTDGTDPSAIEGEQGRWFLAKDYLVFLSSRPALVPLGTAEVGAPFLTDGFGRALYICLDDSPASAESAAVSSCTGTCTDEFPVWSTIQTLRTTNLPSVIAPREIAAFERADGSTQLTFRGWPLYQFAKEDDVQGHNVAEWRLIGPPTFGLSEQ